MALHGKRFVVIEFALGVAGCLLLGVLSLVQGFRGLGSGVNWQLVLGLALSWIGLNYVPLLLHAVDLAERGNVSQEAENDLARREPLRKYTLQQLWLLVPFAVVIMAVVQRFSAKASRSGGPPSMHLG